MNCKGFEEVYMKLFNTLQSRIMFWISVALFVSLSVLIGVNYIMTYNVELSHNMEIADLEVQREKAVIERQFSKLYELSQAYASSTEDIKDSSDVTNKRELVLTIAESVIENNDNIIGINIIFEPNEFDSDADYLADDRFSSNGQFTTYISKQYDTLDVHNIPNYDEYEMYTRALETKAEFFTEPYEFNIQGQDYIISTVTIPFTDSEGNFIGMIGVDFTAEYLFLNLPHYQNSFERRDIIVSRNGTILINSGDANDFGEHVSKYHPNYAASMLILDIEGEKTSYMPNGNLEILYTLELASTGSNWYIFSDMDSNLLTIASTQHSIQLSIIGFGFLFISLGLMFLVLWRIRGPLNQFTKEIAHFDVNDVENKRLNINTRNLKDVEILVSTYNDIIDKVIVNNEFRNQKSKLQEYQIQFQDEIKASIETKKLSNLIVELITRQVGGAIGGAFILDDSTEVPKYKLIGKYGYKTKRELSYSIGEGIIGQVALSQLITVFDDINEPDAFIDLGLTTLSAPHVVVVPCKSKNVTNCVLEIITMKALNKFELEYLDQISSIVSYEVEKALALEKISNLLEEYRTLTSKLEVQQEELRVTNEELESQQEELRVSNEELQVQQEELKVTNEELQVNLETIEKINVNLEEAKRELQLRNIEVERANKYKSEFLANMSHELRTPLNSILILSELLEETQVSEDKIIEYSKTIHSSGEDLLDLINGILDLAKIESGKDELLIDEVPIEKLMNILQQKFVPIAQNKKLKFSIENLSKKGTISTDRKKLSAILTNLISNAIKFTQSGFVKVIVNSTEKEIHFSVVDSGIGISQDNLETIFDEFKQADGSINRQYGGTGLGLSLCRQYAKLLYGEIKVDSELGKGSTFTLIIPISGEFHTLLSEPNELKETTSHYDNMASETMIETESFVTDDRNEITEKDTVFLLIDDDINFINVIMDLIHAKKFKIIVSNTGENGLFLADFYQPHAILLDMMLPGISGQEVSERLKENKRTASIPVYYISASQNQYDLSKDTIYIEKPVKLIDIESIFVDLESKLSKGEKLLIIEDNQNQAFALKQFFESSSKSIVVELGYTGKESLQKLETNSYDIIILDLGIPDVSGFELVKKIKKLPKYETVPIIIYSGKEISDAEETELKNFALDIIIKGDEGPKRLFDDINMFVHSFKVNERNKEEDNLIGKQILIIDDDIRNIFAVSGLLESLKIKVDYATSAVEGIEKLHKNPKINLVLMDIMMPGMNGYEAMEMIRKDSIIGKVPIIALTAKTMKGDRQKCIDAGANEYLSKPLVKNKLLSTLRVWIR